MTPRTVTPDLRRDAAVVSPTCPAGGRSPLLVLIFAALTAIAGEARGYELRLSTENDILVEQTHRDDLYTFSVGVGVDRGAYALGLEEHSFTDREANVRFDETHLTATRRLRHQAWSLELTGGAVHVGAGLFGEKAQNAVHDLIGDEEVNLPYAPSRLHLRAGLAAERWWSLGSRVAAGPRVELDAVPGLHSHALVAAQLEWRAQRLVEVELLAGHRFTDADHQALERRLASEAPVGVVNVIVAKRLELTWSYNKLGDRREHLTLGYRMRGPRVGWIRESSAVPEARRGDAAKGRW